MKLDDFCFFDFTANNFIGFFDFFLSVNYLQLLVVVPIYVFIQRIHNQTQQRSLKAISDELVKINDFVIEFIVKFSQIKQYQQIDDKTISELLILKSKINSHINYLNEYIIAFPYGGPINYFLYFIFKRYIFNKEKYKSEQLEIEYQELILDDTVLSLEKEFINQYKQLISLGSKTKEIDQKVIDKIINKSVSIIGHLESNTRKML